MLQAFFTLDAPVRRFSVIYRKVNFVQSLLDDVVSFGVISGIQILEELSNVCFLETE